MTLRPRNPTMLNLHCLRFAIGTSAAVFVLMAIPTRVVAQGCIAVRSCPTPPLGHGSVPVEDPESKWIASVAYRWYESDRHFVGDEEQPQRQTMGNQVINQVHLFDLAATYRASPRVSLTLDIPFSYSDRSSLYEHDFATRHTMSSGGLGDIRVLANYWLFDPHTHMNANLALGLGVKLPSGDDGATDTAYRSAADGGPTERPVDPSIQPGDGGWGISLDLQSFVRVYKNLFAYGIISYLMTPEEQSETEFTLSDIPRFRTLLTPLRTYNTIPDQYLARAGFELPVLPQHGLNVLLGARLEGVPADDAIGGSYGFRRPGYTLSIEPGLSWMKGKNSASLIAPVAMYRNRVRSAPEEALGLPTGDSAFADYSILFSFSRRF